MQSFIVNSKSLFTALQLASKTVVKNPVVPIIEDYLFQVSGNRVVISGTDLQTTLRAVLPIDGNKETFSFVVPPSIVKYLQKLDEQPVILESTIVSEQETNKQGVKQIAPDGTPIMHHNCTVTLIDEDGRANYSGCAYYKDFPLAPECNALLMHAQTDFVAEFKDMLNYVSTNELRPAMSGINFASFGKTFELCATDGHRIKKSNVTDLITVNDELCANFILPAKPAKILSSLKLKTDTLQVFVKRNDSSAIVNVKFTGVADGIDFELIARTIDERYPDYNNVIPQGNGTTQFTINNKKSFLKLIDKALLFANKTTHQIRIALNGKNQISAEDLDFQNEFVAVVPDSSYSGKEIEIGFNAEFIKEIVTGVSDTFTFEFTAPNKAGVIRDGRATIIVMPVMINKYV